MKDRINQFLLHEHLTPAEFADQIGVQRSSVSHVLNGRNNPSASFLQKMTAAFPQLNSRWLLLGEENMIKRVNQVGNNLFTTAGKTETSMDITEPVQPKTENPKTVSDPISGPALVQSEEKIAYGAEKGVHDIWDDGPGEIERIVVFYSDKTFKAYKPSK